MPASARTQARDQIKASLTDPHRVCELLGLLARHQRQASGGLLVLCPAHGEHTPSCSVTRGPDGTLRVHCFGCSLSGDVFALVAAAEGLDIGHDFATVLDRACDLANVDPSAPVSAPARAPRPVAPPPVYPDAGEVAALWGRAVPLSAAPEASAYLAGRAIDPEACELFDLARVLPLGAPCPRWGRFRGVPWSVVGYRLVVPVYDHHGAMRSLRAWRWAAADDAPKRVAPAGVATHGLVMACPTARRMLAGTLPPGALDVVIAEGEPDYLTHAAGVSEASDTPPAILGVVASAWAEALAERIPDGASVYIRTHDDEAGEKYARTIAATLTARARAGRLAFFQRPRTTR